MSASLTTSVAHGVSVRIVDEKLLVAAIKREAIAMSLQ